MTLEKVYMLPSLLRAESLLPLALPSGAFQRLKQVLSAVSRAGLAETAVSGSVLSSWVTDKGRDLIGPKDLMLVWSTGPELERKHAHTRAGN